MRLAFLDRQGELNRMRRALDRSPGAFLCLYGRRRLGKSRLIGLLLKDRRAVYYVGDERDAALQRIALAREIQALIPGFAAVTYIDWSSLLERYWRDAPVGAVLALDEFPTLVNSAPELPSLLQKLIDGPVPRHLILCGSSQRMMHGLVLDASAPLYGRAQEIIRLEPLPPGWIATALGLDSPRQALEHYALWGGVPRYWEAAADYEDRPQAMRALVLDPMGVLHREPERLLLDDVREVARAASVLAVIGQGCHRLSEIAGRIGAAATALSRPMERLIDLGLAARELPFGRSTRTLYRIEDPFLRFYFRFIEPARSRLQVGQIRAVAEEIERAFPQFLGYTWETVARRSTAYLQVAGTNWMPAARWWGKDRDGENLEFDLVAQSTGDPDLVLVGEAKLTCDSRRASEALAGLRDKVQRCPDLARKKAVAALWVLEARERPGAAHIVTGSKTLRALR
jgi:AAA+ ATPase superfamily predicted ATPase